MRQDHGGVLKLIVAFVAVPAAIWHLHPVFFHWHPAPVDRWSAVVVYFVGLIGSLAIHFLTALTRRGDDQ